MPEDNIQLGWISPAAAAVTAENLRRALAGEAQSLIDLLRPLTEQTPQAGEAGEPGDLPPLGDSITRAANHLSKLRKPYQHTTEPEPLIVDASRLTLYRETIAAYDALALEDDGTWNRRTINGSRPVDNKFWFFAKSVIGEYHEDTIIPLMDVQTRADLLPEAAEGGHLSPAFALPEGVNRAVGKVAAISKGLAFVIDVTLWRGAVGSGHGEPMVIPTCLLEREFDFD